MKNLVSALLTYGRKLLTKLNLYKPYNSTIIEDLDLEEFVPSQYLCNINFKVMTKAMIIDPQFSENPDHILDETSLHAYWALNPDNDKKNPWSRAPITQLFEYRGLQKEINLFMVNAKRYAALRDEFKTSSLPPHLEALARHLENTHYPIPNQFIDPITQKIIRAPIKLDGKDSMDLSTLEPWWKEDETHNFKNPLTNTIISTIDKDIELENQLLSFLKTKYQSALENTLSELMQQSQSLSKGYSYANFLRERCISTMLIPQTLLEDCFDCRIMTDPIRLDGKYLVDLQSLITYWKEWPEMKYMNPITQQPIVSMAYDHNLKAKIDDYFKLFTEQDQALQPVNAQHQRMASKPFDLQNTLSYLYRNQNVTIVANDSNADHTSSPNTYKHTR